MERLSGPQDFLGETEPWLLRINRYGQERKGLKKKKKKSPYQEKGIVSKVLEKGAMIPKSQCSQAKSLFLSIVGPLLRFSRSQTGHGEKRHCKPNLSPLDHRLPQCRLNEERPRQASRALSR